MTPSRVRNAFTTILGMISRKLVNTLTWEIKRRTTKWWVAARFLLLRKLLARGWPWPRLVPRLSARQIYESADALYVARPLSRASVVLVRARAGVEGVADDIPYLDIYADEALGWRALIEQLNVIDVDGGHSSILREPFVQSLATALGPLVAGPASIRTPVAPLEKA